MRPTNGKVPITALHTHCPLPPPLPSVWLSPRPTSRLLKVTHPIYHAAYRERNVKFWNEAFSHILPSAHKLKLLRARGSSRSVAWWTSWLEADQVYLKHSLLSCAEKRTYCTPPIPLQGFQMQQNQNAKCPRGRVRGRAEKRPKLSGFNGAEHWPHLPSHTLPGSVDLV